jgi:hypothetical protein
MYDHLEKNEKTYHVVEDLSQTLIKDEWILETHILKVKKNLETVHNETLLSLEFTVG